MEIEIREQKSKKSILLLYDDDRVLYIQDLEPECDIGSRGPTPSLSTEAHTERGRRKHYRHGIYMPGIMCCQVAHHVGRKSGAVGMVVLNRITGTRQKAGIQA